MLLILELINLLCSGISIFITNVIEIISLFHFYVIAFLLANIIFFLAKSYCQHNNALF